MTDAPRAAESPGIAEEAFATQADALEHTCRPVFDEHGELIAVARVGDLDERGMAALREMIAAARRLHAATDTPERRARAEAARLRNRERLVRLGIRPRDGS